MERLLGLIDVLEVEEGYLKYQLMNAIKGTRVKKYRTYASVDILD